MTDLTDEVERSFPPISDRSADWSARADREEKTRARTGASAAGALVSLAVRIDESTTHERKEQTHG